MGRIVVSEFVTFDGVGMPVSLRLTEAMTAADTLLLRYVRA